MPHLPGGGDEPAARVRRMSSCPVAAVLSIARLEPAATAAIEDDSIQPRPLRLFSFVPADAALKSLTAPPLYANLIPSLQPCIPLSWLLLNTTLRCLFADLQAATSHSGTQASHDAALPKRAERH